MFSYRKGIKKIPDTIQLNSISSELHNRLWNCVFHSYLSSPYFYYTGGLSGQQYLNNPKNRLFFERLWHSFFKWSLDTLSTDGENSRAKIREYFFNCQWFEVFDFIEFCVSNYDDQQLNTRFINMVNECFEQEFSGYRLIDGIISEITDKKEIDEVISATQTDREIEIHLVTALKHLSDRKNPDYRNSIKESISAVESICKKIANNPNATLGDALNEIENKGILTFHGAEKEAFKKLG